MRSPEGWEPSDGPLPTPGLGVEAEPWARHSTVHGGSRILAMVLQRARLRRQGHVIYPIPWRAILIATGLVIGLLMIPLFIAVLVSFIQG
jgi:hypothetical protein